MFQIRKIQIQGQAGLAPMAGVADSSMRLLCRRFGAAYVVGEMASAKGLVLGDRKTARLLTVTEEERPMAVQLFGDDPVAMARAARLALDYHPDAIDINMGCPVPKIVSNGAGSALMKNPALAGKIVAAVAEAVPIPVTVKIRKGFTGQSVNAVEIARIAEKNGAAAVCVHGRTREQMYAPGADWDIIRRVKEAVSIPVMGNGDVFSARDAAQMLQQTGCEMVMVGRGVLGNPWLFSQINHLLETGHELPLPSLEERMEVMEEHVSLLCRNKGEHLGMLEARKHCAWYLKGLPGAAKLRGVASALSSREEVLALIQMVLNEERNAAQ